MRKKKPALVEFVYPGCKNLVNLSRINYNVGVKRKGKCFCSLACARKHQQPSIEERFWAKVDKTPGHGPNGDCWVWTGSLSPGGYGSIRYNNRSFQAHVISIFLDTGKLLNFKETKEMGLHKCDNRACVRPDHLYVGSYAENTSDMYKRGRKVVLRGTDNTSAKLSEIQVRLLRYLFAICPKRFTFARLARAFGMCETTIRAIILRRIWKHVT